MSVLYFLFEIDYLSVGPRILPSNNIVGPSILVVQVSDLYSFLAVKSLLV